MRIFDIVNGFLIDAVAIRLRVGSSDPLGFRTWRGNVSFTIYLAEIIHLHRPKATAADALSCKKRYPVLSMVVWILKREVRAIRGCLGAYRR